MTKEKIRTFIEKHPILFSILFLLVYTCIYMYYHNVLQPDASYSWDIAFMRLALTFGAILFMKEIYRGEFIFGFGRKNLGQALILLWPLYVFTLVNFSFSSGLPVSGLPLAGYSVAMTVIANLVTGLYEEVGIRGVLTGTMMRAYGHKKRGALKAALLSSLLFGLLHLNNFVRDGIPAASFQCFYAFAIGLCFAAVYLRTRNLWPCIVLHGLFDLIGDLSDLYHLPGEPLPAYTQIALERFTDAYFVPLIVLCSLLAPAAGVFMLRASKGERIREVWGIETENSPEAQK